MPECSNKNSRTTALEQQQRTVGASEQHQQALASSTQRRIYVSCIVVAYIVMACAFLSFSGSVGMYTGGACQNIVLHEASDIPSIMLFPARYGSSPQTAMAADCRRCIVMVFPVMACMSIAYMVMACIATAHVFCLHLRGLREHVAPALPPSSSGLAGWCGPNFDRPISLCLRISMSLSMDAHSPKRCVKTLCLEL